MAVKKKSKLCPLVQWQSLLGHQVGINSMYLVPRRDGQNTKTHSRKSKASPQFCEKMRCQLSPGRQVKLKAKKREWRAVPLPPSLKRKEKEETAPKLRVMCHAKGYRAAIPQEHLTKLLVLNSLN